MKYVKQGSFTTRQFSIDETVTEVEDVISIAKDIIKNISDISDDAKKELKLAITNLNEAEEYLDCIRKKTEIALKFVPKETQEKEYL
ncbi:MAG: hypothetical protein IKO56_01665 [Alphaproteobacteria bacterium]|nr:hypothetical protein [Alphaproteobacteria bacterium]MBR6751667.1 hypothetical protein [Alphaproteobacteria bacterium]